MTDPEGRRTREKETVRVMVHMYCRGNHHTGDALCPACSELLEYAHARIDGCPFGDGKGRCSSCEVHCYSPAMRDRIREVMRYSGPRMVLHPLLAIRHFAGRRCQESSSRHRSMTISSACTLSPILLVIMPASMDAV